MKTIILYGRRNTAMYSLSMLVALGYTVKVITDDENVAWLAKVLYCDRVFSLDSLGEFDLFLSVHGNKIIPKEYLVEGKFVNVHPCLGKYNGRNPVKRYIENKDTEANVSSHYMIEKVDEGELIYELGFETPVCNTYADFYNVALPMYFKVIDRTLKIVL